ncbi:MAG: 3-O-methylgallate 3,4-dioxygenase [Chloroflexota bacterium]|nr:3-O-methylgallate 3,4-dioxygenase [Chloroflexota bacterium]
MAQIVLGIGTSHAPQLRMPPEEWYRRANFDKQNPAMWFRGKTYDFPELVEERSDQHFERELTEEKAASRFAACQRALDHLGQTLERVSPDVCVIFGDDQHESFHDDNMPAFSVYWGQTVDDDPTQQEGQGPTRAILTKYAYAPETRTTHPTDAALGRYLIESLVEQGFDMAHTNRLPASGHAGAIGHAFNFVYRRLMNNEVVPNVPMFMNTYYPPNQPTLSRCWALGQGIREALEAWDSSKRVALIASGGLSHFVIEEDLDEHVIAGLKAGSKDQLTDLPNIRFNSGTSEIRNWITLAGAVSSDGLQFNLVDYQPCYRTEAGTGCAMGFAEWL